MVRDPVAGDVSARAQPDPLVPLQVCNETRQRTDASGATDDATVQANAHHARQSGGTLSIEPIEGVATVGEELLAGAEIPATLQTAIVVVEAVGNDQMAPAGDLRPVRQVVVVGVAIVEESAALHDQPPRARAGSPGVPAHGPHTGEAR